MLVWLGNGVLKIAGEYVKKGEKFDPEKVDKKTLDTLVEQGLIGKEPKPKVLKKKKVEK